MNSCSLISLRNIADLSLWVRLPYLICSSGVDGWYLYFVRFPILLDCLAHTARPGLGGWGATSAFADEHRGHSPNLVVGTDGVPPANPLSFGGMFD